MSVIHNKDRTVLANMIIPQRERLDEPVIFIEREEVKLPTTWRRAMHSQLFAPCQVEYGSDGKKTRGMQMVCGRCGTVGRVPVATMGFAGGNDDRQVELHTMRKFSNLGWVIGKQASRHRCPACQEATKPLAAALKPLMHKEEPMPSNGTTPHKEPAVPAEKPAAMSRDDKRVIFAKLNEVYDNERTGYSAQWTDKRVAEDLGVPRAWVALVRDENFGPDHNAEFIEQIAYAKAVADDIKALHRELETTRMRHQGELDALIARLKPMMIVMEKTEKTISAIEKAMLA